MGLLNHMVVLFFSILGNLYVFFINPALVTFPPTVYQGSLFFNRWVTNTWYLLFDNNHSHSYKAIGPVDLICIFLMINDIKHILMYLLTSSFEKYLFRTSFHFFLNWIICLFAILILESLIYFGWNQLLDMWFTDMFSHSVHCLIILLIVAFMMQKIFSFFL